jgi:hypothetical protein
VVADSIAAIARAAQIVIPVSTSGKVISAYSVEVAVVMAYWI